MVWFALDLGTSGGRGEAVFDFCVFRLANHTMRHASIFVRPNYSYQVLKWEGFLTIPENKNFLPFLNPWQQFLFSNKNISNLYFSADTQYSWWDRWQMKDISILHIVTEQLSRIFEISNFLDQKFEIAKNGKIISVNMSKIETYSICHLQKIFRINGFNVVPRYSRVRWPTAYLSSIAVGHVTREYRATLKPWIGGEIEIWKNGSKFVWNSPETKNGKKIRSCLESWSQSF